MSSSSPAPRLRNSPPGKLTAAKFRLECNRVPQSTFHSFCCTSMMRPTTMSPTSPLYRVFAGRTVINLLIRSIDPATEARSSFEDVCHWLSNGFKYTSFNTGDGGYNEKRLSYRSSLLTFLIIVLPYRNHEKIKKKSVKIRFWNIITNHMMWSIS